jgi:hypothetical protein
VVAHLAQSRDSLSLTGPLAAPMNLAQLEVRWQCSLHKTESPRAVPKLGDNGTWQDIIDMVGDRHAGSVSLPDALPMTSIPTPYSVSGEHHDKTE